MPPRAFPRCERLGRSFYARPTLEVAPDLVGCFLVLRRRGSVLAVRLVEVEAYLGDGSDAASHAHRGKTRRNSEMFETPGRLYVYFTYGMHHCMNVVCEARGRAGAVLLRAAEPVLGEAAMRRRRKHGGLELTNGPAKLCAALGVDLRANGMDLVASPFGIWPGERPRRLERSPRIGIRQARELPYRFFDPDSPYVSRGRISL
jgi:DNA-3-methyladenine glycosylase